MQVYEDKNASSEIILTHCISLGTRVTSTEITMGLKTFWFCKYVINYTRYYFLIYQTSLKLKIHIDQYAPS